MINFNGSFLDNNTPFLTATNRGLKVGDALFETIKVVNNHILFWEAHYFRLMASMRILRMEIPMEFTLEFLEAEIKKTLKANQLRDKSARIRLTVYRKGSGLYTPETNDIDFFIEVIPLKQDFYMINDLHYEVDLFKDFYITAGLLSTLKTNNKIINVVGSIYARENDLSNCLLLNDKKNVVEALNGNIFLVKDTTIKTPPLVDGCLNGIIRKQIIDLFKKEQEYILEEASISPFELQKADEIFITNIIMGIQPITKYRKKVFTSKVSKYVVEKLNEFIKG